MPVNHQPAGSSNKYVVPELEDKANAPQAFIQFADSVDAITGIPVGGIMPFAGPSAPTGWFLCDGSEVDAVQNPKLAALILNTYGTAAAGKVKLPDLRGRTPFGAQAGQPWAAGSRGGSATVTLTTANMATHTHQVKHSHTGGTAAATSTPHVHAAGLLSTTSAGAFARSWEIDTGTNGIGSGQSIATVDVARQGGNKTPIKLSLTLPSHQHNIDGTVAEGGTATHVHTVDLPEVTVTTDGGDVPTATPVDTLPPFLGINFIIKGG